MMTSMENDKRNTYMAVYFICIVSYGVGVSHILMTYMFHIKSVCLATDLNLFY